MEKRVSKMSPIERETLIDMIKGLDEEELKIVVENIPIELCVERVSKDCFN